MFWYSLKPRSCWPLSCCPHPGKKWKAQAQPFCLRLSGNRDWNAEAVQHLIVVPRFLAVIASQGFAGWDWCSHLGKKLCRGGLAPGFCFNVTQQLLELLQLESVFTAALNLLALGSSGYGLHLGFILGMQVIGNHQHSENSQLKAHSAKKRALALNLAHTGGINFFIRWHFRCLYLITQIPVSLSPYFLWQQWDRNIIDLLHCQFTFHCSLFKFNTVSHSFIMNKWNQGFT